MNYTLEDAQDSPRLMGNLEFIEKYEKIYIKYIHCRVHGMTPVRSLRRSFGEDFADLDALKRTHYIENNEYYDEKFKEILTKTPIDKLWNEKKSVHLLLTIANDTNDRNSTRLKAAQELNVLCGITITDKNGNTRKSTLADFYSSLDGKEESR